MTAPAQFQVPPGVVVLTTHGSVKAQTYSSMLGAAAFNMAQGLMNIQYDVVPGGLVDKARNDGCRRLLQNPQGGWILFVDADMTFRPDAIMRLLQTAYHTNPEFDVLGGYCNLRGGAALPTIDTGTGTWESHFPNSGVMEVIRTGGAFLLIKRHVLERIPQPWFALRIPMRPLDFMYEFDNFARIKFDGKNPFRGTPERYWERLEQCALQDPSTSGNWVPAEVGEDSGFCDRVRAAGMRIAVDTNVVIGHLDEQTITWENHRKYIREQEERHGLVVGVMP